ncbi:MAG: hypothetical protein KKD46_02440 [Euryarchaeota archaeon]|nr:hypothetical protein [Euryarchaeota archaeon]MBU4339770.1 hypothetical protein [Euryarchaeota archaeon]MBU4453534.1 hypothetical protein [Euryarchaeota archaeon]MCG2735078.1 hypothetical protein [Candidatus Methanoperedenaceae archaeon]
MFMNVDLISVIVVLVVLILEMEFSTKRKIDFTILYNKSLSDLARADRDGKIDRKKHEEAAVKINKCFKEFQKGYNRLNWVEWIKQILPILLMVEILHISLHEFGFSLWYECIWPGLNKYYIIFIILVMFFYFVMGVFRITDKKILDLESKIDSVIAEYIYSFNTENKEDWKW